MNFSKSHLSFSSQYKWHKPKSKSDNLEITGSTDNDLLNRNEGYEMIYFIKQFMRKRKLKSIDAGKKVESLIHEYLPGDIRERSKVENWLTENWNRNQEELKLIKQGYIPVLEFFTENTLRKLRYIVEVRGTTQREVISDFIEIEFDNLMEG